MKTGDIFIRGKEAVRLIRQTADSFYMCQKVELYQYYLQQIVRDIRRLSYHYPCALFQLLRYSNDGCLMDIIEGNVEYFFTTTSNPRMHLRKTLEKGISLGDTFEVIVVKDIK